MAANPHLKPVLIRLFELFPELKTDAGLNDYQAARRTLKKHEARLLVK